MTKETPETQGHKKLRQYFDDLIRNKYFMAKVNKLVKRPIG